MPPAQCSLDYQDKGDKVKPGAISAPGQVSQGGSTGHTHPPGATGPPGAGGHGVYVFGELLDIPHFRQLVRVTSLPYSAWS